MIAKKIYEHAKLHVDGDFPWVHAQRWLNEAQELIASICESGSIRDSIEIENNIERSNHILPKECINVDTVYLNGEKTSEFVEKESLIQLNKVGKYLIEYKRIPKLIGLESDEPELHELYHFPMSYWVGSREQLRFNPDNPDGLRLENAFYAQISRVDKTLSKRKRVRKIKV